MLRNRLLAALIVLLFFSFLVKVGTARGESNDIDQSTVSLGESEVSGTIYREVFLKSVPRKMVVGKSYNFPIFIKNTGKSDAYFHLYLFTPEKFFYSEFSDRFFDLGEGEFIEFDARVVPLKPHVGELNATVRLYTVMAGQNIELDSATASIITIESEYGSDDRILIGVIAIVILGSVLFFYKK